MKSLAKNIEKVEKQLQFTIVVGMFFPLLLEQLLNLSGADVKEASNTILKYGNAVVFLIFDYLLFEWVKERMAERHLGYLSWTFLCTIACYACVFVALGNLAEKENASALGEVIKFIFKLALMGMLYVPLFGTLVMIWSILPPSDFQKHQTQQLDEDR